MQKNSTGSGFVVTISSVKRQLGSTATNLHRQLDPFACKLTDASLNMAQILCALTSPPPRPPLPPTLSLALSLSLSLTITCDLRFDGREGPI